MHSAMDESFLGCPHAFFFYARLSDLLVVANSSLNLFVYCWCSHHFSRAVRGVVAWRRRADVDAFVDSRRETFTVAAARPPASRSRIHTIDLDAGRDGSQPLATADVECCPLEPLPPVVDFESGERHRDVTIVLTHGQDAV